MTNGILVAIALLTASEAVAVPARQQPPQQTCVGQSAPTAEKQARRTEGVRLARMIHSRQVNQPGAAAKKFLVWEELRLETPTGWEVTLDVTSAGYWFMIKDTTDHCSPAFMSNQSGIIFQAWPLM